MSTLSRIFAVLSVVLLTTSLFAGVAGAQLETDPTDSSPGPADDAYVQDDGSVVLVYENDEELDDGARTEYGVELGSSLMYFLAIQPVEGDTEATGEMTAMLTDSQLSANGSLTAPTPDSLESLSAEISGETTDENAQLDATLDTVFSLEDAGAAGGLQSASLTGGLTMTASEFQTSGSLSAESPLISLSGQSLDVSFDLTESDGTYVLDAEQERSLSEFEVEQWASREQARATIEQQFAATAEQFGGSATVTLESYSLENQTDGSATLDVAYTVEYEGVKEALADTVATGLAVTDSVEMSSSEIDNVADSIEEITLDGASVAVETDGPQVTANYEIGLSNYDRAVFAALDVAAAAESEMITQDQLDRIRTQFEARSAADLTQEYEWSADYSQTDSGGSLTAELRYRTENWGAYVDELESSGIPTATTTYDFTAETTDGTIEAEGSMSVNGTDLVDRTVGQLLNASRASDTSDEQTVQLLEGLQESDFTQARTDITLDEENVTIEAGAQFQNLSALGSAVASTGDYPDSVTSIVGRSEDGQVNSYVRVNAGLGSDASEDDVRELSGVTEETTVHMSGDYDREFPEMDTERAANYLGVETESGGSGPGFGVAAAVIALVGAALLARRRA